MTHTDMPSRNPVVAMREGNLGTRRYYFHGDEVASIRLCINRGISEPGSRECPGTESVLFFLNGFATAWLNTLISELWKNDTDSTQTYGILIQPDSQ
jgi:hypothetical protein